MLFALLGGFGNNRNGGGYAGGAGAVGGNEIYPWLNQAQLTNEGFQNQMLGTSVNGIQQAINALSTQLCNCCGDMQMSLANGFAGVNLGICNGFNQAEIAANQRQMANMQQAFGAQTAITQGLTGLSQQFADCCCESRLATANQTATILAENCADRAALSDGVRDIIANQVANTQHIYDGLTAGFQRMADEFCRDRLDRKDERIADLERQLTAAQFTASQIDQTSRLIANNQAQTTALEQYLNPVPIPAYIVQNPNCCQQSQGCGCNGGYGCAA